jgi:hypothetical protein
MDNVLRSYEAFGSLNYSDGASFECSSALTHDHDGTLRLSYVGKGRGEPSRKQQLAGEGPIRFERGGPRRRDWEYRDFTLGHHAVIRGVAQGDKEAEAALIPLVYDELRRRGPHYMDLEQVSATWSPARPDHLRYPVFLSPAAMPFTVTKNAARARSSPS